VNTEKLVYILGEDRAMDVVFWLEDYSLHHRLHFESSRDDVPLARTSEELVKLLETELKNSDVRLREEVWDLANDLRFEVALHTELD
jgi:hypothetical protein